MEFKQPPKPPSEKQKSEAEIGSTENIESQIENLSADEKELFDAWSHITETGRNYTKLRKEGKIDDSTFESLYSQLTSSNIAVKGKLLREQLGNEKSNQIGRLAGEFVKSKESKKEEVPATKPKENTVTKLTPQNIEAATESGKSLEVRVQRSSGQYESGWTVSLYNPDDGLATVLKDQGEGRVTRKFVPLADLKQWQKEISPEELGNGLEKVESFEDLTELLNESGGVQGSHTFYDADQLISAIGKIRKG